MRRVAGAILWVLAALGAVGAVLWVASVTGLARPLVVVSDSMRPAFAAGDLLFAVRTPAHLVAVGDIVAVDIGDRVVAHRVVEVGLGGEREVRDGGTDDAGSPDGADADGPVLRLRGDANPVADPMRYRIGDGVLRVIGVVPGLGRVVETLRHPGVAVPALIAFVAVVALAHLGAAAHPRYRRSTAAPPAAADESAARASASANLRS